MDYDVLILGGGIVGCAVAYELSKYSLNIALIEKDYDIADDVALINSAIIYDGLECDDTLMSKLEFMGNKIIKKLVKKFNVPFKTFGHLIVAENNIQGEKLEKIYRRAINRGIKNIKILDTKDIYKIEANLNVDAIKAIYSTNTGVLSPYDLAISYGEIAFDNGVNFKLEEEVLDIQKISKGFKVITNKNKFTCNMVLNTTPGDNYSIDNTLEKINRNKNKDLTCFLFEKDFNPKFKNILTMIKNDNDIIYTVPMVEDNMILALSSNRKIKYDDAIKKLCKIFKNLDEEKINTFYYWKYYQDNIIIDDSLIDKGYIKVTGKHYGQVTMTPAIAKIVCETIVSNINCVLKKDFIDKRREIYRFRNLSNEERNKIIKMDKKYGKIICACENITEGEIVDAIRRPLGARTIEGVKRRTGATVGSCQGSYCLNKVVAILARETNKKITDIVKDSKYSKIVPIRIKEFDEI